MFDRYSDRISKSAAIFLCEGGKKPLHAERIRAYGLTRGRVNAAAFRDALRAAQKRDENARDRADKERALRAAREEAAGAGVGLMSMFVTVTVLDEDELGRAVADIESRAEVAKIRLRRLWASQAAGFATTLPCGLCPPQLATQWPR